MRAHNIWFHRSRRFGRVPRWAAAAAAVALAWTAFVWPRADAEPGSAHGADAPRRGPVADEGRLTVTQLQGPAVRSRAAREAASAAPHQAQAGHEMLTGHVAVSAVQADPARAATREPAHASAGHGPAAVAGSRPLRNERAPDEPDEPPRWLPQLSDTWHLQLTGVVRMQGDAAVHVVDLFDFPDSLRRELHDAGKHVVCLFSAGSAESWRPDHARFLPHEMGAPVGQAPDERWVDTRSANVREIMTARLDHAAARGCDAVALGAVDGYSNSPGLALNAVTQLEFNRFMAAQARSRGLAVGLMNDVEQLAQLAPHFDFAVNAQCHEYDECVGYRAFVAAKKPVFNVEHDGRFVVDAAARAELCAQARAAQLRTLVLPQALDGSFRFSCDTPDR